MTDYYRKTPCNFLNRARPAQSTCGDSLFEMSLTQHEQEMNEGDRIGSVSI
jgi:hypothetical protein